MSKAIAWCNRHPLYTMMLATCFGVLVAHVVELVFILS